MTRDPLLRLVVGATACIVAAFVGVGIVSIVHLRRLDRTARELASEIAPRIECGAASRGLLRALSHAERDGTLPWSAADRKELQRALTDCGAVDSLAALSPWLSGDADLTRDPVARRAAFATADAALEQAVEADAARAAAVGRAIEEERQRVWRASVGLHGLAAFVALFVVVLVGITSRQQARLARERAELEARERRAVTERAHELELFASRVAHDLKSPLSAVVLYLRAAAAQRKETHPRDALIEDTVSGAIDIVDALLDYARAAGDLPPGASADVGETVEHVMQSLRPTWRDRGAAVHVDVPDGLVVACPRGGLCSIVANLVRNAFEHGVAHGARRVDVRAERRGDRVRLEVSDDGPGVPDELRARLFDAYVRGDRHGRANLGLGLATVRRLAEGCGGTVAVDAPDGGGARFWVELPVSAEAAAGDQLDDGAEQRDVHAERG